MYNKTLSTENNYKPTVRLRIPDLWPVGSSRYCRLSLSARFTGYILSCSSYWLHFLPCFSALKCFSALFTGFMFSRAFDRLLLTGYMFSRTLYCLLVLQQWGLQRDIPITARLRGQDKRGRGGDEIYTLLDKSHNKKPKIIRKITLFLSNTLY